MSDNQNNKSNKLFEIIKQHPTFVKVTGSSSGGLIFLIIINKMTGFLDEIDFNNIIKWVLKLKSLIQGNYTISLIVIVIIICITICKYKKINDNTKIRKYLLKTFYKVAKDDKSISHFTLKGKKSNPEMSIIIERDNNTGTVKKKSNGNIIDFPPSTTNDLEVK